MNENTNVNQAGKGSSVNAADLFEGEKAPNGEFSPVEFFGGFTKGKLSKVFISAVTKDGTAIRVEDRWYEITDRTRNEAGELKKGMKINLYYAMGEKKNFANAIYPVTDPVPTSDGMAVKK